MNQLKRFLSSGAMRGWVLSLLIVAAPLTLQAQWLANVGAENADEARQGNAFLPNEIWIHAGDNITWTFVPVSEIHTVTFLTAGQVRLRLEPASNPAEPASTTRVVWAARHQAMGPSTP